MAASSQLYDCVIIGGGPAGLSAAIYAGREGMKTLVLDKGDFGGMAAVTETIDNYPGFSKGVGGRELIDEMTAQAKRFGAELQPYTEVTALEVADGMPQVTCGDDHYSAKTILVATGSDYRKLGIPGEEELIGRGLHFCATCDGPLYKDKHLVVVGGGNSALQESLFLARFARSIDVLVWGDSFTGSEVLQQELAQEQRITVHYNVHANKLVRDAPGRPIAIQTEDAKQTFTADGIFVFVGLLPNTHGITHVATDDKGFITSGAAFETNLPGVFVAGDVRSGSTWQIGSAVGEGVSAALVIRHFLDTTYPGWHKK